LLNRPAKSLREPLAAMLGGGGGAMTTEGEGVGEQTRIRALDHLRGRCVLI
jgi:hypothetical protein